MVQYMAALYNGDSSLVLGVIDPTGHWSYVKEHWSYGPLGPTACDRTLILSDKSAFETTVIPPGLL